MKTRNAMQLKALINNKAKAANVSPQLMLQGYMLERLIERVSVSRWRDSIVIKGGVLIGSLIGIDRRTTKDLDTTVVGLALSHETARHRRTFRFYRRTPHLLGEDLVVDGR